MKTRTQNILIGSLLFLFFGAPTLAGWGFTLLASGPSRVPVNYQDYVGTWSGPAKASRVSLTVSANGDAKFEERGLGWHKMVQMPARGWSAKGFSIGTFPIQHEVHVTRAPHLENGTWHMTADGVDFEREDESPAAAEAPVAKK